MKVTDEQKQLIEKWLTRKRPHCSTCSENRFAVVDRLYELREFNDGNLVIGGDSSLIPTVVLTCTNCGQMLFMNAIILGVVGSEKVVKSDEPDS